MGDMSVDKAFNGQEEGSVFGFPHNSRAHVAVSYNSKRQRQGITSANLTSGDPPTQ